MAFSSIRYVLGLEQLCANRNRSESEAGCSGYQEHRLVLFSVMSVR